MRNEFIIKSAAGFWDGQQWAQEYPAARLFTTRASAVAQARKTKAKVQVIEFYGMSEERTIWEAK